MGMKIKKDDEVIVISGKDKGKTGKVISVSTGSLKVGGIAMNKKHVKPNPEAGVVGGIVERESFINISNVAIFNSTTGKADRVGFRFEDGKKVRFFKSNGNII